MKYPNAQWPSFRHTSEFPGKHFVQLTALLDAGLRRCDGLLSIFCDIATKSDY